MVQVAAGREMGLRGRRLCGGGLVAIVLARVNLALHLGRCHTCVLWRWCGCVGVCTRVRREREREREREGGRERKRERQMMGI